MKLHNTLTRQIEELIPIHADTYRMYSCGPTVYNHIHIGNLSSFIFADILRRSLSFNGLSVEHVMNFTDVDDKTIKGSRERYPDEDPKTALLKLTEHYSQLFLSDMQAVGNDVTAIQFIKATDSIEAMQQMISRLVEQGYAYIADDGIYFSLKKYMDSGKKYGQLATVTAASTSEARIANDEYDKDSAHDFALWKKQKPGEPAWEYQVNGQDITGRPGWHIECSAMSETLLGQPFDIHTGGVDLTFPHHENEIAQSTAGQDGNMYAHVFAHNEHLLIDGKKMSKSLNNFHTLETVTEKGFDPLAFRLLVLQAHYRSQAHFSWDNLQAAQNRLQDLRAMAVLRYQALPVTHDAGTFALEDVPLELATVMQDDLKTPQALTLLSNVSTQLQTVLIEDDMVDHFEIMLDGIDKLLGLKLADIPDITSEQKDLIAARESARDSKDWAKADDCRNQLLEQGITVRDTAYGSIWSYR